MLGYEIQKVLLKSTDLSTKEIVNQVGCDLTSVYLKLKELESLGLVKSTIKDSQKRWELTLDPPLAKYFTNNNFAASFSAVPKSSLKVSFNKNGRVENINGGSIISLFQKTKPYMKIVCPHFLELKWGKGCHYHCAWCYLPGTYKDKDLEAEVKDPQKIREHLFTFLQTANPDILNAGEVIDSLCDPNIYYIVKEVENQKTHKLLLLTKSCSISPLLKINDPTQTIVSFTINSTNVAKRWEKDAPPPENRLDAAHLLHDYGYPIRLRIDPIVPYPDSWKTDYKELIDNIFSRFRPERITLGTLRGLQQTYDYSKDTSWWDYLSEKSGWGLKMPMRSRSEIYLTLLDYLSTKYNFSDVGICKETRGMWNYLQIVKKCKLNPDICNCTW